MVLLNHLNNVIRNQDACIGCSEIGIGVIVKHVKHLGTFRAFCQPRGTY